jgi:hypothetical protein
LKSSAPLLTNGEGCRDDEWDPAAEWFVPLCGGAGVRWVAVTMLSQKENCWIKQLARWCVEYRDRGSWDALLLKWNSWILEIWVKVMQELECGWVCD